MKLVPSAQKAGTIALMVLSLLTGFIFSILIYKVIDNNKAIESVYAESVLDNDLGRALALQNVYRKVASHVLPVVVEIDAVEFKDTDSEESFNPFRFFREPGDEGGVEDESPKYRSEGLGSGIIVRREDDTYYVLTNNHVAGNADEITIKLFDERSYDGVMVGTDERKDLALVSFETDEDLAIGTLGDSDDLYVGDFVLAVGNPFGFKSTVTSGIVSALGRQQGPDENISDFIQTDAAINQGNSGGALVNLEGEIIGVNTWITTPTGGSIGLGFSIPINNAKKAIEDIISNGSPEYGWLGVSIFSVSQEVADSLGLESARGVLISQVFKNSPAQKGGLKPGDVVMNVDGKAIKSSEELNYLIGDIIPGTRVSMELIRDGIPISVSVRIEKRESEDSIQNVSSSNLAWPGALIGPLTGEIKKEFSIDDGETGVVVYDVYPKTPMQIAGLKDWDIIKEVNGSAVTNLQEFYRILNSSSKITITYVREGVTFETSTIVK
ncbi:Do family serine endopeptidase [Spirochaeta isovalerica]|uniref:Do/DeqQ family serine protease n=1 Tax=Spirochaeta isovalerica TaxID=150 RepID=A0A841R672_9SPIO|nr:Do family serine endopeptidase [Spirochaeta isovalerica]MBB6478550.1 Do/DeqQ family serine protease [Spirochaeta isovalerica]